MGRAFHQPFDLAELTADFYDDLAGGPADRQHAQRAEQERQDAAEKEPDDHQRIRQVEGEMRAAPDFLRIGREQHQCGEPGRADCVALGDGFRCVAHGIEGVGDPANGLGEIRHLRDAAGIVCDGAISVDGHDDAGHR